MLELSFFLNQIGFFSQSLSPKLSSGLCCQNSQNYQNAIWTCLEYCSHALGCCSQLLLGFFIICNLVPSQLWPLPKRQLFCLMLFTTFNFRGHSFSTYTKFLKRIILLTLIRTYSCACQREKIFFSENSNWIRFTSYVVDFLTQFAALRTQLKNFRKLLHQTVKSGNVLAT